MLVVLRHTTLERELGLNGVLALQVPVKPLDSLLSPLTSVRLSKGIIVSYSLVQKNSRGLENLVVTRTL